MSILYRHVFTTTHMYQVLNDALRLGIRIGAHLTHPRLLDNRASLGNRQLIRVWLFNFFFNITQAEHFNIC